MTHLLARADCRRGIPLADGSVHCVITSPPFFGLRDYQTARWEGGDPSCDHLGNPKRTQAGFNERYFGRESDGADKQGDLREPFKGACGKCGARRVDAQIGLEPTVDCDKRHLFRLRSDLTEAQREYVVRRLLASGSPGDGSCDTGRTG